MNETRKQARTAGLWYLLMGVTAPIGLMFVPGKILVLGDATATADNIRASEHLVRLGIASELVHQAIAVPLVLALFRLFKAVNEHMAWHMVCLGALVSVPIMYFNVLNEIAALILVSRPDFLSAFDPRQLDALAYLLTRLHDSGITLASVFWGLWLFPFGMLAIRSGFVPKVFGILLFAAGIGYVASAFSTLVLPQLAPYVNRVALILEMAEVPILFWLVIWGLLGKRAAPPATAAAVG